MGDGADRGSSDRLRRQGPHRIAAVLSPGRDPLAVPDDVTFRWHVRVQPSGPGESRVYARNHAFGIGSQASFSESDLYPSAVEMLLGALGGDLLAGWVTEAARAAIEIDAIELTLSGRLENPLVHLGVVGETGSPRLAEVTGTLYIASDTAEDALRAAWQRVIERSPVYATLSRAATLSIRFERAN